MSVTYFAHLPAVSSSTVLFGSLAALLTATFVYYKSRKEIVIIGKVSELVIYPIKACPGIPVKWADCTECGLRYKNLRDRQFMVMENGKKIMLTQNLKLLIIAVEYQEREDCLLLEAPEMENLRIPLAEPSLDSNNVLQTTWYDSTQISYIQLGKKYSDWFSLLLNKPVIFAAHHSALERRINPEHNLNPTPDHKVMFAGSHPYLITNESTLQDLNKRINSVSDPVRMNVFRPNIVISKGTTDGSELKPYDEDNWKEVCVGPEVVMCNSRPCLRCQLITVDYEKQQIRPTKEPMTTLFKYRRGTGKKERNFCVFGINTALLHGGKITVQDHVAVTEM